MNHSVDEIADGPAKNKGERCNETSLSLPEALQHRKDKADRYERNNNQERQPKCFMTAGKHTECRTGIADVREAQKSIDDRNRVM